MPQISYRTGVVLVLLAGLLWSTMGLVIRLIEAGTWQILFWRSLGLVPVLFVVIALRARGAALRGPAPVPVPRSTWCGRTPGRRSPAA